MDRCEIFSRCDHTALSQCAVWEDIKTVLDEAVAMGAASACIPPSYVKRAKEYVGNSLPICTVIGFPNGYSAARVKLYECECALADGADEIDTVINIGALKDGLYDEILSELTELKRLCADKILKVIIETCLLSEDEKIKMCELVSLSGADFIKTSTGFSSGGATLEDVVLFKKHIKSGVKIKAAGGIRDIAFAEELIKAGADRIGESKLAKVGQL